MTINWQTNRPHTFTAKALVKRRPELHHLHWRAAFAPATKEPWERHEDWALTFGAFELDSENDFWPPLGRWRATANTAAISPGNAIEILLDDVVVATLSAPEQVVEFLTPWDTGGNAPKLTARLTDQPLDAAEVSLYFLEEYDLSGQPPRWKALDDLFVVEFSDAWSTPYLGVITAQPVLYDGAGNLLGEGPELTLTLRGESGGG